MAGSGQRRRPAAEELRKLRGVFAGIGVFSAVINMLMLAGSLYMLQVYDRVLSSRSVPTLIGISLILLAAFALQGVLDAMRSRMLARAGAQFDEGLSPAAFDLMRKVSLRGARADQATQAVRDVDTVRAFLGSLGPTAFFDMPFMWIFFLGCFLLHPHLGVLALIGAGVIIVLTLLTESATKKGALALNAASAERTALIDGSRRNAEALQALGMGDAFRERWRRSNETYVGSHLALSDATGGLGSGAKVFRMAFQSAVLGYGAYLVILQQMSPGAMIAASIMTSRALAPIEVAVAHWKGFVASRQAYRRLNELLAGAGADEDRTALPAPRLRLTAADVAVGAPGRPPLVVGASLSLKAGEGLLLVGPSGGGKSTLVRALAGVWPILKGDIRLDGAALDQWAPASLGRHVGYMPQDVELFEGTIAQNIGRFMPEASDEEIVAAATAAGAHDMILRLPDGYGTAIGEGGLTLSGGQRQRVGLARALFRDPFLVILDEPNSNLDADGETALAQALIGVRERGGVAVVVSHKTSLANTMDYIGRIHDGRLQVITREEYRQNLLKAAQAAKPGPRPVPTADAPDQAGAAGSATRQQVGMLRQAAAGARRET